MGTIIKKAAALGAVVTLGAAGACAPVAYNYGEAVAYNKAIQTVNPAPVYTEDGAQPGDNGERAVLAVENYRAGGVGGGARGGSSGGRSGGSGFGGGSMGGLGAATGPR